MDKLQEMQEALDKMNNAEKDSLGKFITAIKAETVDKRVTNAIMPDYVFQHKFLPHFIAAGSDGVDSNILGEWMSVSGGPFAEVDIVDSEGKVIATTPGLYNRPTVDVDVAEQANLSKVVDRYRVKSSTLMGSGENYLLTALSPLVGAITTEHVDTNTNGWKEVLLKFVEPSSVINETAEENTSFSDFNDEIVLED